MAEPTVHLRIRFFLSQKLCIKRQKRKMSFILHKSWMQTSDVYLFHYQLWCWSWEAQMFTAQLNDAKKKLLFPSDTSKASIHVSYSCITSLILRPDHFFFFPFPSHVGDNGGWLALCWRHLCQTSDLGRWRKGYRMHSHTRTHTHTHTHTHNGFYLILSYLTMIFIIIF